MAMANDDNELPVWALSGNDRLGWYPGRVVGTAAGLVSVEWAPAKHKPWVTAELEDINPKDVRD